MDPCNRTGELAELWDEIMKAYCYPCHVKAEGF